MLFYFICSIVVAVVSMLTAIAWNHLMPTFGFPGISATQALAGWWLATLVVFIWNNVLAVRFGSFNQRSADGEHHPTRSGR